MNDKKLTIISRKYRGDSVVISARIASELLKKIDEIAEKTGRTRNEIIQVSLEYAVDNMEIK